MLKLCGDAAVIVICHPYSGGITTVVGPASVPTQPLLRHHEVVLTYCVR